jgi:hypothetical protein
LDFNDIPLGSLLITEYPGAVVVDVKPETLTVMWFDDGVIGYFSASTFVRWLGTNNITLQTPSKPGREAVLGGLPDPYDRGK